MSEVKLGQLLNASAKRDAIHIAIAPVIASEKLNPGQRIGFDEPGCEKVRGRLDGIGIVDPFLTEPIVKGQRFYMLLMPNTITSLRHEWTHPAFIGARSNTPVPSFDERRAFLAEIALAPDDELPHKIYADWLEKHGEIEEAKKHREWSHDKASAEDWLRHYAKRVCPYDDENAYERFMDRVKEGDIFYHGKHCHYSGEVEDADELYRRLSIVLGRQVGEGSFTFSCSC
jgi:uncharacterized protein (TIGR02996 family)